MTGLKAAAQQALEALDPLYRTLTPETPLAKSLKQRADTLRAALAEPALQTCNCCWDGEVQVQQCNLHEAHVDAIHEWAERAKTAEKKLAALAEPVGEPVTWDGRCVLGYCGLPSGCEDDGCCRAIVRAAAEIGSKT